MTRSVKERPQGSCSQEVLQSRRACRWRWRWCGRSCPWSGQRRWGRAARSTFQPSPVRCRLKRGGENNNTGDIKNDCIKNKYNNLTVHPMSSFLAPRSSRNQKRKAWYKSVKIAEMSWCLNCWCLPRWIPRRPRQTSSSQGTLQPEEENRFAKRMSVHLLKLSILLRQGTVTSEFFTIWRRFAKIFSPGCLKSSLRRKCCHHLRDSCHQSCCHHEASWRWITWQRGWEKRPRVSSQGRCRTLGWKR